MSKKIRLLCQSSDAGAAVNVGGPVVLKAKTFDVDVPDAVWMWLVGASTFESRMCIGVEPLETEL